jgi:hypothetical protein
LGAEEYMQYWITLNRTVEASLAKGQVGQPVFVRCTAAVAECVETMKDHLAEMIYYVNGWLTASVCRVYALGEQAQGHVVTSLEYDAGYAALLACTLDHKQPQIDLIILGSNGAMYHRNLIQPLRDGLLKPKVIDNLQQIMVAIDQSLATGQPVHL